MSAGVVEEDENAIQKCCQRGWSRGKGISLRSSYLFFEQKELLSYAAEDRTENTRPDAAFEINEVEEESIVKELYDQRRGEVDGSRSERREMKAMTAAKVDRVKRVGLPRSRIPVDTASNVKTDGRNVSRGVSRRERARALPLDF